ncbi:MAG: helix-turn-helix domain-containing protein [Sphingobacteriales bacterium]|nr:MAG: helix-turn-helix domain-containing protein [Sphingobacteriales bacterium]
MVHKEANKISYVELPQPSMMLTIEPLDYANPYDFKALHRHDYFEIVLVKEGSGSQLIDFSPYDMQAGEIFVIYPGQVHLMKRNTANGLLIQFKKDLFEYINPVKHYHLYSSPSYRYDAELFSHLYDMTARINALVQQPNLTSVARHKAYSYLQIILITLIEAHSDKLFIDKEHFLFTEYLSLVTANIHTKKKVADYGDMMNCSAAKLNEVCKKSIDRTALEVIHEELLLEIRRLLLLNELSFKEISYHLNFDSPSNFNAFIKNKTGLTPKELQHAVLEIYN